MSPTDPAPTASPAGPAEPAGAGWWAWTGRIAGPLALLFFLFAPLPLSDTAARAAGIAAWMAIWWVTEAVSIYRTSLLPIVLFPAFGVFGADWTRNVERTLRPYVDDYIWLFFGGMCIAAAMEKWNLHRRIALHILRLVGAEGDRLLLGFLIASAAISFWISNTATAVMMLPIGMAVLAQLEADAGGHRRVGLGAAIMLSIAYGANVGGIGTKIGTAPNAIFCGYAADRLGHDISFLGWSAIGVPFVLLFLPVIWWVLRFVSREDVRGVTRGRETVASELARLGPTRRTEWLVLAVFAVAAGLWIAGQPASKALGLKSSRFEAFVSLGAAGLLIALRLLDFAAFRRVPWSTLLLLGGAFSMAAGIEGSGLSAAMGESLSVVSSLSPMGQIFATAFLTVAASAVASNVATITVMLPILHSVTGGSIPVLAAATVASSCDFALPAGTPPNAIVFGSGYLTVPRMARVGFVLDLLAALVIGLWFWLGVRLWIR